MPNTKIINVLRDDRLEDILQVFRSTPAEEVIFVLPKRSKAFESEGTFAVISDESQELGKNVLILSENQRVKELAGKYSLGLLTSNDDDEEEEEEIVEDTRPAADEPEASLSVQGGDADDEEDGEDEDDEEDQPSEDDEPADDVSVTGSIDQDEAAAAELESSPDAGDNEYQYESLSSEDAVLAAAKASKPMNDVVAPDPESAVSLKINKKAERPARVDVKPDLNRKYTTGEQTAISEIQSVWQSRPATAKRQPEPGRRSSISPRLFSLRPVFSSHKNIVYALTIAVVLIFAGVLYVSMGKAEIVVKPRASDIDIPGLKVSSADTYMDVDVHLKRIPGQLFLVNKKIEESFLATGEKDVVQKARGKITVYNEYGTTAQTLIATTRFESESGLVFRTLKTVTVPGTTVRNGQITPGAVEVEIIADKAGDTYNVSAGKFTIPAFREKGDNDRYQKFYGKSDAAMKGGIIGKAKVVTEQDYMDAKNKVAEKIAKETEEELKAQASGLKILDLGKPELKEITVSAQIDEAVDTFTVSASAEMGTVGFDEADLFDVIAGYIRTNNDIVVLNDKLTTTFNDIKFDKEAKVLEFSVAVKGTVYSSINEDKFISDLVGKGEAEIKEYAKGIKEVQSVRVKLSPFWVWKVPTDRERIHFRLEY